MADTFRACFYKGTRPGIPGIYNRLVRARGDGKYSHVELQFSRRYQGVSASASFEDGGTRFKYIEYSNANWDFIDLPLAWEPFAHALMLVEVRANQGYDLKGNLHIALGFIKNSEDKNFCSEVVAKALKIEEGFRFEPNALYVLLRRLVTAYNEAKQQNLAVA